ncbi:hypothetical protein [Pseudomonas sp. AF03-9]|uniref:hypothetical protein n=1 Tax=Pseudomonas sp. AF03-9 TaxID=2849867 RepID=UPI001CFB1531|nr:hypothetical protein [Pseudomonas sp. AF03-9]
MDWELVGIVAALIMILSFPGIAYSMLTKLETAENYLPHSVFIVSNKSLFRGQPFEGKAMRLMLLAYVLIMPKVFYWRRLVDLDEVARIPRRLKIWIIAPCLVLNLSGAVMTATGLALYL